MDISRSVKEQSTYKPLIMRMVPLSSLLNRWVLFPTCRIIYRIVFGETPFTMGLLQWAPAKNSLVNSVHSLMARPVEDGFNTRHILRRKILVQYALDKNLLLIGAANRSEAFAGLFIKDGVDDLPIEPLIGLYKTQVRQLARHLQIPQAIVREHPSPDMFKGITDEDLLGYSYEKIDKVAYVLDRGLSEDSLFREGITPNELEDIKRLNCISAWKRNSVHESPNLEPG
jgi:NAD+ synthase